MLGGTREDQGHSIVGAQERVALFWTGNRCRELNSVTHDFDHLENQRWAIVGGGMLGLALAMRLAKAGQSVVLYEAAPVLGGLASAWQLGDVVWDRHYHVTLLSDTTLRRVLDEIGLEQEIRWVETKTGFYTDGQHYSMSNNLEFLTFPPLSLIEKIRLGWTIFYASKIKAWRRLESLTVAEWLRRWSGKGTFEKIWLPLLKAKLGSAYKKVSAGFIWAHINRMYAARRTGLKKEMFGYVPGGYARILERMADELVDLGVDIRLGCPVAEIESLADGQATGPIARRRAGDLRQGRRGRAVVDHGPGVPTVADGRTPAARKHRVPRHYLFVDVAQTSAQGFLRHQHHRWLGAVYRCDRDDHNRATHGTRRSPIWFICPST